MLSNVDIIFQGMSYFIMTDNRDHLNISFDNNFDFSHVLIKGYFLIVSFTFDYISLIRHYYVAIGQQSD